MISKELTVGDFKKCTNDINNSLIVKNKDVLEVKNTKHLL